MIFSGISALSLKGGLHEQSNVSFSRTCGHSYSFGDERISRRKESEDRKESQVARIRFNL